MKKWHFLTYCTHKSGAFELLLADAEGYNIKIDIAGWGSTWTCHMDKAKSIKKYITTHYNGDDFVVVLDAFDVRINGDLNKLRERYTQYFNGNPIVISAHDGWISMLMTIIGQGPLNAGMYLGRVENIRAMLTDVIGHNAQCNGDDQRALNRVWREGGHPIAVDWQEKIFCNKPLQRRQVLFGQQRNASLFCQYPGVLTWQRWKNCPFEYYFLVKPLLVLLLIALLIIGLLSHRPRR